MKVFLIIILAILALWLSGLRVRVEELSKTHTPVKPTLILQVYWIWNDDIKFYKEFTIKD